MPVRHSCASVSGRLQNSCVSTREQKKAAASFPRLQLARSFRARFSQTHHYSPTSWISYFIKWMVDLDPFPYVCGLLINKGSETESRAVCNHSIQNVNYWGKKTSIHYKAKSSPFPPPPPPHRTVELMSTCKFVWVKSKPNCTVLRMKEKPGSSRFFFIFLDAKAPSQQHKKTQQHLMGIRQADAEMLSHCILDAAVMGCKWEMGRWAQEEKATGG